MYSFKEPTSVNVYAMVTVVVLVNCKSSSELCKSLQVKIRWRALLFPIPFPPPPPSKPRLYTMVQHNVRPVCGSSKRKTHYISQVSRSFSSSSTLQFFRCYLRTSPWTMPIIIIIIILPVPLSSFSCSDPGFACHLLRNWRLPARPGYVKHLPAQLGEKPTVGQRANSNQTEKARGSTDRRRPGRAAAGKSV